MKRLFLIITLFFLVFPFSCFGGGPIGGGPVGGINGGPVGSGSGGGSQLLKTGQTISYHAGDDGDLELGIAHSYIVLTTGRYAGNTNVTINSKTYAFPNACVKDNNTGKMWARTVPQSDIGPAADGKLFWGPWTLASKTDISFDSGTKKIHSGAGEFDTGALCAGRKFTVAGSAGNDGTYTVSAITANDITTVESLADEAASASITITTVDDLIWDLVDQANANNLAGYTDWRIPNVRELISIVDLGQTNPAIDATVFPSTPSDYYWTASTNINYSAAAWFVRFSIGYMNYDAKRASKYYVRLVRN